MELPPTYLSDLVPHSDCQVHAHNTRGSNYFQSILCKTTAYFNSFLLSVIREWNKLSAETKKILFTVFKNSICKKIKLQYIYYIGTRLVQIYHARLRLKCSSLKLHLYDKNLIDNPLCPCGLVEDTDHFLLHCRLFQDIRSSTIFTLPHNLNTDLLLYGDHTLTPEENEHIFLIVQKFILCSKRFP